MPNWLHGGTSFVSEVVSVTQIQVCQMRDRRSSRHDRFCAGFRMPGCRDHRCARRAGVRKAPRQEIAGCGAPTVQRALWGFGVGESVGEVEARLAIGSLKGESWACVLARTRG